MTTPYEIKKAYDIQGNEIKKGDIILITYGKLLEAAKVVDVPCETNAIRSIVFNFIKRPGIWKQIASGNQRLGVDNTVKRILIINDNTGIKEWAAEKMKEYNEGQY